MSALSSEETRQQRGRVLYGLTPDLRRRIGALRKELALSQRAFAEKVWEQIGRPDPGRLSHTQVSAWERGKETPSADKLIALGTFARTPEERAWFWAKAGVTEEAVRATFPDLAVSRVRAANSAEIVEVPLGMGFSVCDDGGIAVQSERSLLLPAEQFGSAPFILSVELDADSAGYVFSPGDIVIVDQSPVSTRSLMDSLVLMFFEHRPEAEGVPLSPEQFAHMRDAALHVSQEDLTREERYFRTRLPKIWAKNERGAKAAAERTRKWMDQPVARIGWLRLQPARGKWEGNIADQMSLFALELQPSRTGYIGRSIPLTDWMRGVNPLSADVGPHIKRPVHIVGRIVGWLRAPAAAEAGT